MLCSCFALPPLDAFADYGVEVVNEGCKTCLSRGWGDRETSKHFGSLGVQRDKIRNMRAMFLVKKKGKQSLPYSQFPLRYRLTPETVWSQELNRKTQRKARVLDSQAMLQSKDQIQELAELRTLVYTPGPQLEIPEFCVIKVAQASKTTTQSSRWLAFNLSSKKGRTLSAGRWYYLESKLFSYQCLASKKKIFFWLNAMRKP